MQVKLPSISNHAIKYGIKPNKKLGQNFIYDFDLCKKLVKNIEIKDNYILEVGPGVGGLTRAILSNNPKKLFVIEKDHHFLPILNDIKSIYSNLEIIHGDATCIEVNNIISKILSSKIDNKISIISNLPYNVGTKILVKYLKDIDKLSCISIVLQKEVVDRIIAKTKSKKYGRLSVIVQSICTAKKILDLSPKIFFPVPEVSSALIKITPKKLKIPEEVFLSLENITRELFNTRRKKVKKSLLKLGIDASDDIIKNLGISADMRPEDISPSQYLELANIVKR